MPSVFLSYSHKDEVWKDRLRMHLGVLEAQGFLETWDDRHIEGRANWLLLAYVESHVVKMGAHLEREKRLTEEKVWHPFLRPRNR